MNSKKVLTPAGTFFEFMEEKDKMKNFRTFQLAVEFYRLIQNIKLPGAAQEQCRRASLSIALNLAEGRGKPTKRDQLKFFYIAFGSVRECQAILILHNLEHSHYWKSLDSTAAALYKLIHNAAG